MSSPRQGLFSLLLAWIPAQRGIAGSDVVVAPAPAPASEPITAAPEPEISDFAQLRIACDNINMHFEEAFAAVPALGRPALANKAVLHPLIVTPESDMEIHMMKDSNNGRYVALNIRVTRSPCYDQGAQKMTSQLLMYINTKDNTSTQPQSFCPGEFERMEEVILDAVWNKLDDDQQARLNNSTWPYPYYQAPAPAPAAP